MTAAERCKAHEALRLTVYDDANGMPIGKGSVVKGNPTIGWGTLVSAPGGITKAEADYLFANRWDASTAAAATLPAYAKLDQVRQGVLIEMVFQMGLGGVRAFVHTLAAMERGDYASAAAGMRASAWARETPERAEELAQIMECGS